MEALFLWRPFPPPLSPSSKKKKTTALGNVSERAHIVFDPLSPPTSIPRPARARGGMTREIISYVAADGGGFGPPVTRTQSISLPRSPPPRNSRGTLFSPGAVSSWGVKNFAGRARALVDPRRPLPPRPPPCLLGRRRDCRAPGGRILLNVGVEVHAKYDDTKNNIIS